MVPQTSQSARPSKTISCHCSRRSGAVRGVSLYTVAGVNTHVDKIKAKSVVAHQIWSDMQLKHKAVFFLLSFDEAKLCTRLSTTSF